jgi:glycosyltransferase involved in cell wall biosynthesis
MKDVGIVMPVYKQDPIYLELALRSILEQSYQNYDFVIVSDGAPSETIDKIREVTAGDNRVHLILKDKNEGVAKALNKGFDFLMELEEVKYFTWVSSDNIYYPSFLEKLRNALAAAPPNVGLSYSSFRHVDYKGDYLKEPSFEEFYKYQEQPKENILDVCFIGVSFMYKKQVAAMIDGYRLEPVEDYEYWLRLTEHCDIVYIPEALMDYRTDAPLSISAQLKNSPTQHRRWRYAFNLAKLQARNRRQIPNKISIIFPVEDGSEKTIEKLEKLLEQSFSNYKLIIIDRSPNKSAIEVLQHIEDPRIKFIEMPGVDEREALIEGFKDVDTPFAMIYGKGPFPSTVYVLYNLFLFYGQLIQNGMNNITATFDNQAGRVAYSTDSSQKEPQFGYLYLTEKLLKIIKGQEPVKVKEKIKGKPKILINSVPKSGTHLLMQIICGIPGMSFRKATLDSFVFYDGNRQDVKTIINGDVAIGHLAYNIDLASDILATGIKHLFISRDLRDIAVSYMHFIINQYPDHVLYRYFTEYLTTNEQRLRALICGIELKDAEVERYGFVSYPGIRQEFEKIYNWKGKHNLLEIRYEDLVTNEESQKREIQKIIEYLWPDIQELNLTKENLRDLMIKNINPETCWTFRKGIIGGWKEIFTEELKDLFKKNAGKLLIDLGYEKDSNW